MRILHINEHLAARGGVETYLLSLIPQLEALGHEPAVAFADGDSSLVEKSYHLPLLAKCSRSAELEGQQAMRRLLNAEDYDVVHLHNIYNVGAIEACLEMVPTVLTAHDYRYVCPASNFFYRHSEEVCERTCGPGCFVKSVTKRCLTPRPKFALRYYRRVRWMMRNAHRFARIIAPSGFAKQRFVQAGFLEERADVLPYYCPINPLAQPRPLPAESTVVFIGRLSLNKGYKHFVNALGLLSPSVRGRIVGNLTSERETAISRLAMEAGCVERLELCPWAGRDEIQAILQAASILIFPSVWPETLGIIGLEALATGVPVVASDIGGVREWLIEGQTGRLVPPKDSHAIAEAAQQILDEPSKALEMGQQGIDLIRERFDVSKHIARLTTIYEHACFRDSPGLVSRKPLSLYEA